MNSPFYFLGLRSRLAPISAGMMWCIQGKKKSGFSRARVKKPRFQITDSQPMEGEMIEDRVRPKPTKPLKPFGRR